MINIINWHKHKYPLLQKSDIYKLIYQGEFGPGHSITNKHQALARLLNEVARLENNRCDDLYEEISDNYVRVNLLPYKKYQLDLYYLFDAFINSITSGNENSFKKKLKQANLDYHNIGPIHHSEVYQNNYHPHYRVINKKYLTDEMKLVQCLNFINNLNGRKIIALEGKCGSGKTTIAKAIAKHLPITIIEIDDFFLPQARKTKTRLNEIGGNIDYEAVHKVLTKIAERTLNSYQKYNCTTSAYEEKPFIDSDIIILEGVYSYHPYFRHLIDYLIFLDIDNFTQNERLKSRTNYSRFIEEWIPLENTYFESENIKYLANIIV